MKDARSDQELIAAYLNDDENAFAVLLSRHQTKISTHIRLLVQDTYVAEDIFQEVFIKIIDTLRKGKYNHEGKFSNWAVRIAHNLCVDYFRRNKRKPPTTSTDTFDIFDVVPTHDDNAEQGMMRSQTYERLRKLVDSLPFEQREVVILRHYTDMSFKEIAELTGVSINTALGRMRYALINLRRMIDGKEIVL
jgi:RNA polymerase sigma factor (sigma-70 family)